MFMISLRCALFDDVNIFRRNKASTPGLAIKFYASAQSVWSRVPAALWVAMPDVARAFGFRTPDPARYAGQESIEIKATVLSVLYVTLNNARSLMAVPCLAKILVLCISKCIDRHADPHDLVRTARLTLDRSEHTPFIADESRQLVSRQSTGRNGELCAPKVVTRPDARAAKGRLAATAQRCAVATPD
jgi:hypothetical protein